MENLPDFEQMSPTEVGNRLKLDFYFFRQTLLKFILIDKLNGHMPASLSIFSSFFFNYHQEIYKNPNDSKKIYDLYLEWHRNQPRERFPKVKSIESSQ